MLQKRNPVFILFLSKLLSSKLQNLGSAAVLVFCQQNSFSQFDVPIKIETIWGKNIPLSAKYELSLKIQTVTFTHL